MTPRALGRLEGFTVACLLLLLLAFVVVGVRELAERAAKREPRPWPCWEP